MSSREIITLLENDGWYEVRQKGSHIVFKHPTKTTKSGHPMTVPHPKKDMPKGTARNILKEAGLL